MFFALVLWIDKKTVNIAAITKSLSRIFPVVTEADVMQDPVRHSLLTIFHTSVLFVDWKKQGSS